MVGTRLRRLRTARGMTQRELGAPRYSHAYISTIEAGRRRPSAEALEHFASKLGVGTDELLTGRQPDLEARLRLRLQEARIAISRGRFDDAEADLGRVAREAKRFQLRRIQAKVEEVRGLSLQRRGRTEDALERYREAEELLRDEPPAARADAVDGKAACFAALGDVRYSVFLLEGLLGELERSGAGDPEAMVRIHSGLVFSYVDAGLLAKAAESAAELERLAPTVQDPLRLAQMHMNVARQYLVDGRPDDATASLQRAEDAYRSLGLETEMGGASLARGMVLLRGGDAEAARIELERARDVFERTGNTRDLPRTLNELGDAALHQGRDDEARSLLERSIALLGTSDDPILAFAHLRLGVALAHVDPPAAEKHARTAIELYERTDTPIGLAGARRVLGDLLSAAGDETGALESYRSGLLAVEPLL